MSVEIRAATDADIPTLVGLMTSFYAEADLPLPVAAATRAFQTLLADDRLGGVWLASIDGEPAGHVVLTVCFSMEYGGLRGFIDDLYVRSAVRRRGVAAGLLAAARVSAVERGVRALHVEAGPDNRAAGQTYARAGYVDSGHVFLSLPLAAPVHA